MSIFTNMLRCLHEAVATKRPVCLSVYRTDLDLDLMMVGARYVV